MSYAESIICGEYHIRRVSNAAGILCGEYENRFRDGERPEPGIGEQAQRHRKREGRRKGEDRRKRE